MSLWEIILLGVVQGLAEFLPISSSGHLVIIESLMGHSTENLSLNIALHFGTLLSILVVFRKELIPALKDPMLVGAVVIATIPIVISAIVFGDFWDRAASSPLVAGIGLLITSALLFCTPYLSRGTKSIKQIKLSDALVVGLFQAVAPCPGISRSGASIVGALLAGVNKEAAAKFAFYIAVPAIGGAVAKELLFEDLPANINVTHLTVGMVVSFLVGIASLQLLLKVVAAGKLKYFAWYTLLVGVLTIAGVQSGYIALPEKAPEPQLVTSTQFTPVRPHLNAE